MKKKYTKNEIIKIIKGMFSKNTMMFAYFCGSEAYHTKDDNSDTDVIAVFADITGVLQMSLDDIDIFIYGIDHYKKRFQMDEEIPLYNRIFVDDYLYAKDNLIYLDEKFKSELDGFVKFDFSLLVDKYLTAVIEYFSDLVITQKIVVKRNYHLFRIHEVIKRYLDTGIYDLLLTEETHQVILDYKNTWKEHDEKHLVSFENSINELIVFKKKIEGRNKS